MNEHSRKLFAKHPNLTVYFKNFTCNIRTKTIIVFENKAYNILVLLTFKTVSDLLDFEFENEIELFELVNKVDEINIDWKPELEIKNY